MPFVGADIVKGYIRQYRVLNVTGGYGSGKSAIAFAFAYDLLKSKDALYLLSNCANVWDEGFHYHLSERKTLDTVIVLDEGGMFLSTWKDAQQYLFALRKINVHLIIPSLMPVSTRISFLRVWRAFNGYVVGLPFYLMNYRLRVEGEAETGKFLWMYPQEIFGVYDTAAFPVDDMGIGAWLNAHVTCAITEYYEREQKQRQDFMKLAAAVWGLGTGGNGREPIQLKSPLADVESSSGPAQDMLEAASIIQETFEQDMASRKKAKRRRLWN